MRLVLVRHGNTFGPKDTVVYVGKTNDLPLVVQGIEQAHRVADALLAYNLQPQAIYCGTLSRLADTAYLIAQRLGLGSTALRQDPRLDELDYGLWTGHTRDAVVKQFGADSVRAWECQARWPACAGWTSDAATVQNEIRDMVQELAGRHSHAAPVVLVSSNGRLRYFLSCVPEALVAHVEAATLKVSCGHVCALEVNGNAGQEICWNQPPARGLGQAQKAWGSLL